jgi:hypothetical protein
MASRLDEMSPTRLTRCHKERTMKTKFSKLALIAAIGLAAAGTSYAHEDYSEARIDHWLRHVSESQSAPTANQLAPFGYAATKNADREVSLASGSKYLNVTRLETRQAQCRWQECRLDLRYARHRGLSALHDRTWSRWHHRLCKRKPLPTKGVDQPDCWVTELSPSSWQIVRINTLPFILQYNFLRRLK